MSFAQDRHTVLDALREGMREGILIAVCGEVGSGKTTLLRHLRRDLAETQDRRVAESLAVEKMRVRPETLITALLCDLAGEKQRVPAKSAARARALRELVERHRQPVALFIDDAHDLPLATLAGLAPLCALVGSGGTTLSVVLAGRPVLAANLRRTTDYPLQVFTLAVSPGN